jgi:hypothetical protein
VAPWNSLLFNWKGPIKSPLFANVGSKKTLRYLLKEFDIVQKELQQQQLLVVDQVVVHVVVIMILFYVSSSCFFFLCGPVSWLSVDFDFASILR